jgi:RimJ/RimL family protein N-acetyltransferase
VASVPSIDGQIGFRRMTLDDLPMMLHWLSEPHVRRWWDDGERTLDDLREKYAPCIDGRDPTDPYLILLDGRPVGYLQTYLIVDHPEYASVVQVEPGAAGLDVFLGEPDLVGRGLGPRILSAFVERVVFARPEVTACVIGPAASNAAAIRAYAKAGFVPLKVVEVPGEAEPEYLMIARRP